MIVFNFPVRVASDYAGYNFLSYLAYETITLIGEEVNLNFQGTIFFEGNLCSVLGSIIDGMLQRQNKVNFLELNGRIQSSMLRNKFYTAFTGVEGIVDNHGTTIHYSKFHVEDEFEIKSYVERELLNRTEMPELSEALKREIIIKIFEIYANALTHGQSEYVFSCGQLYPRKSPPYINFTFVDLGKTIKNNVIEFLGRSMGGSETIIWATSDNNSTKRDNHSGGIGLKLIKEFIEQNGGSVQIVSGDGFWEFSRNGYNTNDLKFTFPGTIVNLTFNVNDDKKYYLASEIRSTANIF